MNHRISQGHIDVSGRPNEVDRTARFTPSSIAVVARGTTDAKALAALASEMHRIAEEIAEEIDALVTRSA